MTVLGMMRLEDEGWGGLAFCGAVLGLNIVILVALAVGLIGWLWG